MDPIQSKIFSAAWKAEAVLAEIGRVVTRAVRPPNGLRRADDWVIADGDEAAVIAVQLFPLPPEIATTALLAARYGAQIAVTPQRVLLFLPDGIPSVVQQVASVVGFDSAQPGLAYQVRSWEA